MDFDYLAIDPARLSATDRQTFIALVRKSGKVNPATLPGLVDQARCLGLARSGSVVVGVGGLKRPNEGHRGGIFAKAESKLDPAEFPYELGWFYTMDSARKEGVATTLMSKLLLAAEGWSVYATSDITNESMHRRLKEFGFVPEGQPYASDLGAPNIQLFVLTPDASA